MPQLPRMDSSYSRILFDTDRDNYTLILKSMDQLFELLRTILRALKRMLSFTQSLPVIISVLRSHRKTLRQTVLLLFTNRLGHQRFLNHEKGPRRLPFPSA